MIALRHAPEARSERGHQAVWFRELATERADPEFVARHAHPLADGSHAFVVAHCGRGHSMELSPAVHQVAADGKVSPSLVCPACNWHVFVRLDGWTP